MHQYTGEKKMPTDIVVILLCVYIILLFFVHHLNATRVNHIIIMWRWLRNLLRVSLINDDEEQEKAFVLLLSQYFL